MSQYYYATGSAYQYDMGYPGIMIMASELMGDIQPGYYGYDWFWPLNACLGMQDTGGYAAVPWYTLYGYVKAANSIHRLG